MPGCAFTGHRSLPEAFIKDIEDKLVRGIEYAYSLGIRDFYAGGAMGFDTCAARAVIKLRERLPIRLCLVLPCRDQDARWSAYDSGEYRRILSLSDSAEYISDRYYSGCMAERNRRLIEYSDMLIAYVTRRSGGSFQTAGFASDKGIPVYNIASAISAAGGKRSE